MSAASRAQSATHTKLLGVLLCLAVLGCKDRAGFSNPVASTPIPQPRYPTIAGTYNTRTTVRSYVRSEGRTHVNTGLGRWYITSQAGGTFFAQTETYTNLPEWRGGTGTGRGTVEAVLGNASSVASWTITSSAPAPGYSDPGCSHISGDLVYRGTYADLTFHLSRTITVTCRGLGYIDSTVDIVVWR